MNYQVISFYRYTEIDHPQQLKEELHNLCSELKNLGRILLGKEGINGAISGKKEKINQFKQLLAKHFTNLTFREQDCENNVYHKLVVRIRNEIVAFGQEVDLKNTGIHLSPNELKLWYEQQEDFVIIDARNDYEYEVGKFKGALGLPIKNFRALPQVMDQLEPYKNKKVVMYCTGGIRCEKASAYLKEQGFTDVYQLQGGIINFVNQYPDTLWEGNCFVFDDRLVSDDGQSITSCQFCNQDSKNYTNCYNLDCDKLFISCNPCLEKMNKTCSEECSVAPRQRKGRYNKVEAC